MRIESQISNQVQKFNASAYAPIRSAMGQGRSSIFQNSASPNCLQRFIDWFSNLIKRLCSCCTSTTSISAAENTYENKLRSILHELCNRNNVQQGNMDFIGAPEFKACLIFKMDDRVISMHYADVNMDALENGFRLAAEQKFLRDRPANLGREVSATLLVYKAREDNRFDGRKVSTSRRFNENRGEVHEGRGSANWPRGVMADVILNVDAQFAGGDRAHRDELTHFLLGDAIARALDPNRLPH